jgi:hypothetical protein
MCITLEKNIDSVEHFNVVNVFKGKVVEVVLRHFH